tara:strand:- start:45 stop:440 length:396 start_codon:yes stop_codon:yes gene_type:complete
MMKKLLLLLFSIFLLSSLSVFADDIYYCSDDENIGYDLSENFKIDTFIDRKFRIMIDFNNLNVISESIYMGTGERKKCIFDNFTKTLYCISSLGTSFSINKNTLSFARSEMYIEENQFDDYTLSYGTCEKF